ncbi:MAG: hypothetical protein ACOCT9_02465 [archaeon]
MVEDKVKGRGGIKNKLYINCSSFLIRLIIDFEQKTFYYESFSKSIEVNILKKTIKKSNMPISWKK